MPPTRRMVVKSYPQISSFLKAKRNCQNQSFFGVVEIKQKLVTIYDSTNITGSQ